MKSCPIVGVPIHYPDPDTSGDGVLFSIDFFVYIFLSFFVSLLARLRGNGSRLDRFAWNFQGRCAVTMGRPDYIFGQFRETVYIFLSFFVSLLARLRGNGSRLDRFAWNFQGRCAVTMGRPDYIFGQFRETARCRNAQHGDGVCCAIAP